MINSIDAEIASDKTQYVLMIKMLKKLGTQGTYFNIIKAIYDKPTANIILSGEKPKAFPLRSRKRQAPTLIRLFNTVPEVLGNKQKQKAFKLERSKIVLFAGDVILL